MRYLAISCVLVLVLIGCRPAPTAIAVTLPPSPVAMVSTATFPPATVVKPVALLASPDTPIPSLPPTVLPTTLPRSPTPALIAAKVAAQADGLRLRSAPNTNGTVIQYLSAGTALTVAARTDDNQWLRVSTADGDSGWVMAAYVEMNGGDVTLLDTPADQPMTADTLNNQPDLQANPGGTLSALVTTSGLRLRNQPGVNALVLANLNAGTRLTVIGRTADSQWLQVSTPDGGTGWVWARYVTVDGDVNSLNVTGEILPTPAAAVMQNAALPGGISGIPGQALNIFRHGQNLGNRANVFSKIGDSILGAPWFLGPFTYEPHTLYDYENLRPALDYFSQANARDGNSLVNASLAAHPGFSTYDVLDPSKADARFCQPNEAPIVCEYRIVKPAVALIMLGTNDAGGIPPADYERNLNQIVQYTIDNGIIPVLFTIPPRAGHNELVNQYNPIIVRLARDKGIPLVDFWTALQALPKSGLQDDGTHPSLPSWQYESATDLSPDNLRRYGFPVLNLMALQALDALWRDVLSR